ncbi:MAG TPA: VCBS repeat-containing protein [Candidatus Nanopelagicales bacterium]|nr:VCBS repeat-containing protein [Candidatus Nanopelagicales bacterium]
MSVFYHHGISAHTRLTRLPSVLACGGLLLAAACGQQGAADPGESGGDRGVGQEDPRPSVAAAFDLGWTDETAARGLGGISSTCTNVAFGDMDGDGAPDLIVPGAPGFRVYRNDGAGQFSLWSTVDGGLVEMIFQQCAVTLADMDGDGRLDVGLGIDDPTRAIGVFFNDGDGAFTAAFGDLEGPDPLRRSYCMGVARGSGGKKTLFVCRMILGATLVVQPEDCGYDARGVNVECPVDIAKPTSRAWDIVGRSLVPSTDPALSMVSNTQGLGISDFDGDGGDDLFIATDFEKQVALRGGQGGFEDVSTAWGADVFGHGMGVALGDIDEDGYTDAVVTTIGGFIDLKGLGPDGFELRGDLSPYSTHRRNVWPWAALFVDLDNNGHQDFFAANEFSSTSEEEPVRWMLTLGGDLDFVGAFHTIVFKDGATSYREARLPFDAILPEHGRGQSFSTADVDGDGRLEVALSLMRAAERDVFDVVLGRPEGTGFGHGLTVRFSGAPAPVGTVVSLDCGGRTQTRRIYGAEGTGAAARGEAHFGCGEATTYEGLRVVIPGRAPIELPGGPLDQAVVVPLAP